MALAEKDLEIVTEHIQKAFPVLCLLSASDVTALRNNHVSERGIREEERHNQKEFLETIIQQMDKLSEQMDKRFEQMDKRFAEAREDANRRFAEAREDANRRSEDTNRRFAEAREDANRRSEDTNRRFAEILSYSDKRFEQVDKHFQFIKWMIAIGFTAISIAMPLVLKYI